MSFNISFEILLILNIKFFCSNFSLLVVYLEGFYLKVYKLTPNNVFICSTYNIHTVNR